MEVIADFYFAQPYWIWAGLAAALLAIEVLTGSGWLLWVSASAGATAVVVAMTGANLMTALLVFAALTLISTLAVRRYMPRTASVASQDINDNISRIVGLRGSSVCTFSGGAGRVSIDGKEWAAQLIDGDSLAAGVAVEVTGVEGSQLRVRRC